MSKFADFVKEKKIDTRRLINASHQLERLLPADRAIKLAKRKAKKSEDKKDAAATPAKPRSGRPVTARSVDAAIAGKPISGPQKTRILRAVNHILEQKKAGAVELKALF